MSKNGVPDLEALLHFVCERVTSFPPENTLLVRAAATVAGSIATLVTAGFAVFTVHSDHDGCPRLPRSSAS